MSDIDQVTLDAGGKPVTLPVLKGTLGNPCIDISRLPKETGCFTYDSGFTATASCKSAVTYIDGDEGVLLYRGYPIDQLAEKSSFLEVASLLIDGELPDAAKLQAFEHDITHHTMMHEALKNFFTGFRHDAHPMAMLCGSVASLSAFYHDTLDLDDPEQRRMAAVRLIAKMPTLAAAAYRYSIGWPISYPDNSQDYVTRFLRMMFEAPGAKLELNPVVAKALDLLFILHADHEQNASTSTVSLVGSADANIYVSMSSGVNALSGPLHGGANQAVLEMLREISAEGLDIKEFVSQVKDKKSGVKLMGFGHRVYKNYDPRAKIIKGHTDTLLRKTDKNNHLLDMALELEETALNDEYFIERKLYPNVDFYTGLIYEAMGFPPAHFTALFALGRLPGWIAQWREQHADPKRKIGRPRQIYIGEKERDYVPINER